MGIGLQLQTLDVFQLLVVRKIDVLVGGDQLYEVQLVNIRSCRLTNTGDPI